MSDTPLISGEGRDNFSSNIRDLIAKKSGYICAYPDCRRMTIAGSSDRGSGLTMTGVAAHITAASRGGPRFDASMSPEERSSESNGIWLCQNHGKYIDDNPSACTIDNLRRWKAQHEDWVFRRVESGTELFNQGAYKLSLGHIGPFRGDYNISLGRHNVLVGDNGSGKTSLCQVISAFTGGEHWKKFNKRFNFTESATQHAFAEIHHQHDGVCTNIRLTPQNVTLLKKRSAKQLQGIHVEVNGFPSIDWPRSLFKVLHFDNQLRRTRPSDPQNTLIKGLRYLSTVLAIEEEVIWGGLREEFFVTSAFGYKFRRTGRRKVDVLVPDGRDFYLPFGALSSSEKHIAFIDIALKMTSFNVSHNNFIYAVDSGFYSRMDDSGKVYMFDKLTGLEGHNNQTLFCIPSDFNVELLKGCRPDKWINSSQFGKLTLHSFL